MFDQLAPSLGLKYGMEDFPFSVKPDSLVDVRKVMALLRDTYEAHGMGHVQELDDRCA